MESEEISKLDYDEPKEALSLKTCVSTYYKRKITHLGLGKKTTSEQSVSLLSFDGLLVPSCGLMDEVSKFTLMAMMSVWENG